MKKLIRFALYSALSLSLCLSLCSCKKEDKSDDTVQASASYTPIFDAYCDFVDAKSEDFSDFTSEVCENRDLTISLGDEFIAVSSADLAFLPLALLQNAEDNGGSFNGSARGCYDCNAVIAGPTDQVYDFEICYSKYGGGSERMLGQYNHVNGYFYCKLFESDNGIKSFEFMPEGSGYKAQYISFDDEDGESIRISFSDEAAGLSKHGKALGDIAKKDFDALHSEADITVLRKDGRISADINGQKLEYGDKNN